MLLDDCINPANRNSKEYRKFVKKVKKRDGQKCVICGETDFLHVHHLLPFEIYKNIRIDTANGVTLCKNCHGQIHGRKF